MDDVIVVGAGPAGAATAILFAEQGLETMIVDRGRLPRPKICGEYLSPEAGRLLDRPQGVDQRPRAVRGRRHRVLSPGARRRQLGSFARREHDGAVGTSAQPALLRSERDVATRPVSAAAVLPTGCRSRSRAPATAGSLSRRLSLRRLAVLRHARRAPGQPDGAGPGRVPLRRLRAYRGDRSRGHRSWPPIRGPLTGDAGARRRCPDPRRGAPQGPRPPSAGGRASFTVSARPK